jgi:hypothetical protein
MKTEFIPYELALKMKHLGFDEPCFATYQKRAIGSQKPFEYDLDYHTKVQMSSNIIPINSEYTEESKWISAPLYQQAFKWFRKNYRLSVNIHDCLDDFEAIITQWTLSDHKVVHEFPQRVDISYPHNRFDSYEEAELSCLVKLIEIVK